MTQDSNREVHNAQVQISDPIRHVVVLMLENHSFDQMLGCMQAIYPELEGINPDNPQFNFDAKGNKILQKSYTETQIRLDPNHDCPNVLRQLSETNGGFIKDFVLTYPQSTLQEREYVMGYYPLHFLPALHALASNFTICDHWFSSVPGPTWPNRFFLLSGTSSGRVRMPEGIKNADIGNAIFYQNQKTIFDCLSEAGKKWKIYYYDFPLSLVLTHQRHPDKLIHYENINNFFTQARGPEDQFPEFTFIEPKYLDIDQNDDHPPHNVMKAEKLIADVYNAIRSNAALWESTLLVVVYDEHGGFYDHVIPPACIPPDDHREEYTFDRLGVRVPALLISPWVDRRIEKTVFDHTSLLKYLIEKWQLNPLGQRTQQANSISAALRFDRPPQRNSIPFIRVPNSMLISKDRDLEQWSINANQKAIHLFSDFLALKSNLDPKLIKIELTTWAYFKKQIGQLFINLGRWFERDYALQHQDRISRTCTIVDDVIKPS